MARKEFPEIKGDFGPKFKGGDFDFKDTSFKDKVSDKVSEKVSIFSNKFFQVVKFLLGICFLPFVYSSTLAFLKEFGLIQHSLQVLFWNGVIAFLLIYLFIWEPAQIYTRGHKIMELLFNFFKPLVRIAPNLLPIYSLLVFFFYTLLFLIYKDPRIVNYSVFLFGFTITLHLVFAAKSLRTRKGDFLKGNYIFGFSFIWLINLILLSLFLNVMFKEFSFINFFDSAYLKASGIIYAVFKQLFLG
ncbi:MAG: hypothetical protein PHO70_07565 [Candidatus Omnitrophica bacterium]|nr:hypothetical protein [Candidatus Omnitrophota bacterium]